MQSSHHDPGFTVRLADPDARARTGRPAQPAKSFRQRRRNRHGRGLRGELMLPTLPGYRTRSDRFDDFVLDSAQRLHDIWGKPLDGVRFAVDEIPPGLENSSSRTATPAPMGSYTPATAEEGPVITLYRRVVEQACGSRGRTPGPGARRGGGAHGGDARRAARVAGPGVPPPLLTPARIATGPRAAGSWLARRRSVSQRDRDLLLAGARREPPRRWKCLACRPARSSTAP